MACLHGTDFTGNSTSDRLLLMCIHSTAVGILRSHHMTNGALYAERSKGASKSAVLIRPTALSKHRRVSESLCC